MKAQGLFYNYSFLLSAIVMGGYFSDLHQKNLVESLEVISLNIFLLSKLQSIFILQQFFRTTKFSFQLWFQHLLLQVGKYELWLLSHLCLQMSWRWFSLKPQFHGRYRKIGEFWFVQLFCWYKDWNDSFQTLYFVATNRNL